MCWLCEFTCVCVRANGRMLGEFFIYLIHAEARTRKLYIYFIRNILNSCCILFSLYFFFFFDGVDRYYKKEKRVSKFSYFLQFSTDWILRRNPFRQHVDLYTLLFDTFIADKRLFMVKFLMKFFSCIKTNDVTHRVHTDNSWLRLWYNGE